jgi:hypothetical protein
MNDKHFDSPVFVKTGNMTLQIAGIMEALEFWIGGREVGVTGSMKPHAGHVSRASRTG